MRTGFPSHFIQRLVHMVMSSRATLPFQSAWICISTEYAFQFSLIEFFMRVWSRFVALLLCFSCTLVRNKLHTFIGGLLFRKLIDILVDYSSSSECFVSVHLRQTCLSWFSCTFQFSLIECFMRLWSRFIALLLCSLHFGGK